MARFTQDKAGSSYFSWACGDWCSSLASPPAHAGLLAWYGPSIVVMTSHVNPRFKYADHWQADFLFRRKAPSALAGTFGGKGVGDAPVSGASSESLSCLALSSDSRHRRAAARAWSKPQALIPKNERSREATTLIWQQQAMLQCAH